MKKRWLIAIIAAYLIVRTYIATLSSYGFYHGWNEGHYSIVAKNYFSGSLWKQIIFTGDTLFAVPPMFSYVVFASFRVFGISDISARLVSILSEVVAVLGVYILARELYSKKTADTAAVLFIFIPWNIVWFSRVQTDPLMVAFMTLAIALYVYAHKNNKSMMPFGIALGIGVFTKQPVLMVLPIVLIWSYFEGIKKEQIKKAAAWFLVGLLPLAVWLSYYLVSKDTASVSQLIYGELAYRSSPFSDSLKVTATTLFGLSPLLALAALYEIIKMVNRRVNPLIPWLVLYGFFVLVRTPPSHEYYSLPLTPVFAILTAKGAERFSKWSAAKFTASKRFTEPQINTFILLIIIITTLPFSYALLSYSGELGYTSTKDAGAYLNSYMDSHPQDTFYVITPSRYVPQVVWYSNLTMPGYSKRQVLGISNELGGLNTSYIESIAPANATVFLVTDDREGFADKLGKRYERVFSSVYETRLPDVSGAYTGEGAKGEYFYQSIEVFRIR